MKRLKKLRSGRCYYYRSTIFINILTLNTCKKKFGNVPTSDNF